MKDPNRKIIPTASIAILVMGVAAVIFFAVKKDSDLPVYEGKNVEEWFFGDDNQPGDLTTKHYASQAFQNVGTNTIPYLIEMLKVEDTLLNTSYHEVYKNLPSAIRESFNQPLSAKEIQVEAIWHLNELPPEWLAPYAEELMGLYPKLRNYGFDSINSHLVRAGDLRCRNMQVKTSFFDLQLSNTSYMMRLDSALILSRINRGVTNGIPILINAIINRQSLVFSNIPTEVENHPRDLTFLEINQKQREAYSALSRIAPELAEQYSLEEPQP